MTVPPAITVASALVSFGLAMALLIGRDVAAGLYLCRILSPGTHVETSVHIGRIVALRAATTEFQADDTSTVHVPSSKPPTDLIRIEHRPDPDPPE